MKQASKVEFDSHTSNNSNPHKVTAAQVGLGNVQNFGLATEDEAKQGISNAKYMTPSLTQAVLSANINSIAHANSADGTDRFTTVYPNLNLLDGTKDFSGTWGNVEPWYKKGFYRNLSVMSYNTGGNAGIYKSFLIPSDGIYSLSLLCKVETGTVGQFVVESAGMNTKIVNVDPTDGKFVTQSYTSNFTAGQTVLMYFRFKSNDIVIKDGVSVAGHKIERGSIPTPWMPSASEVITADWPKYVGFSNTVKTNKSANDYTWFPVKDSELTNKVDSHVNNKANPHSVTASQVGTYTKQEIDTKLSKTVMADDSGKVTVKTLQVETIKSNSDTDLLNLSLTGVASATFSYIRINGIVYITAAGNWGNFPDNKQRIVGNIPAGFRPPTDWGTGMNPQGGSRLLSAVIKANGDLGVTSDAAQNNVYGQFSMSYPGI
ncbi:hypothetical protein [Lactococcus lactis]|uniref:hypothetical protein n=1 Tax=Lactococcus lactis TaxID=1358 RepID=UPI0021A378C1|nr:hypothetical protein [Lactococcus lactis]MCT0052352.1 hypothetical protein [Lactococcus lactis subsp. lactis]